MRVDARRWLLGLIACVAVAPLARPVQGADLERGHQVFEKWCAPCHASGAGHPGTTALAALYHGAKPAPLEERTDLSPALVRQYVRHGVSVMPFFRKTEISDTELDALGAYLSKQK